MLIVDSGFKKGVLISGEGFKKAVLISRSGFKKGVLISRQGWVLLGLLRLKRSGFKPTQGSNQRKGAVFKPTQVLTNAVSVILCLAAGLFQRLGVFRRSDRSKRGGFNPSKGLF